jgi:hypothetical protein
VLLIKDSLIPHFVMGYLMFSNSKIIPFATDYQVTLIGGLPITTVVYVGLFLGMVLIFGCVSLARLCCYGPFMKRYKIFGR